jgi:hypothetical protein
LHLVGRLHRYPYTHNYAISIPDGVTSNYGMITEYQLQKYRRKRSVFYFEVLSLYLAEEAEENYENPRYVLSLDRDLKAGPSGHEGVGVTVRPYKNKSPNQKDRFISSKQVTSLTCERHISIDQLSNIDKRRKSVVCVFAEILKQTIMHAHDVITQLFCQLYIICQLHVSASTIFGRHQVGYNYRRKLHNI